MAKQSVNYVAVTPTECELSTEVNSHVVCEVEGCQKTFTSGGSYYLHKTKTHPTPGQTIVVAKKSDDVVYRYHCPVINCHYSLPSERHFTTRKYLKQHYGKVHGEKKFICNSCEKGFAYERDLRRHRETCGVVFKCVTCSCPYTTPEAVLTHCRRKQHQVPDSAKSSRRGSKKLETEKRLAEQKVNPVPLNPCIIIVNQTSQPVMVPNSFPVLSPKNSEATKKLPNLLPKSQFSSSVVIHGTNTNSKTSMSQDHPVIPAPVSSLCHGNSGTSCKAFVLATADDGTTLQSSTINSTASIFPASSSHPTASSFQPRYSCNQQTVAGIQTDIYGVETLYLNSVPVASTGTQANALSTSSTVMSSTGMQTSMSFLPIKKRHCSIAGTQTATENILDQALKAAQIPTQMRREVKKSRKTSEVQTSGSFSRRSRKRKMTGSKTTSKVSTSCGPDPQFNFHMSLEDLASNSTQTNLSYLSGSLQSFNLSQNIQTQTGHLSPQHHTLDPVLTEGENTLFSELRTVSKKQLLQDNLDLLADATLTNFLPMHDNGLNITESEIHISKRFSLGDPALGAVFSTSMDSESQTITSASDLDILLQSSGQVTDIQTQTVQNELLDFLMNNMETQTTEDLIFPEFGLSDIETQTLSSGYNPTSDTSVASRQSETCNTNFTLTSPPNPDSQMSSVGTEPDTSFLLNSLVNTETQTNLDLTFLSDMETQTTFNTVDFYTDFTDSHTQTSFF